MKVVLGKFARSGIEAQGAADLAMGVSAALHHYAHRVTSSWTPVAPPRFLADQAPIGEAIELAVGPEMEATLEREARRHHVSMDQILAHAVLTYLADTDAALNADAPEVVSG